MKTATAIASTITLLLHALAGCGDGAQRLDAGIADAAAQADAAPGGPDGAPADGAAQADAAPGGPDSGPDAAQVTSDLRINEILLDPAGASDADEFLEVKGAPDTDYSAFALLEVDGDFFNLGYGRGVVLNVLPVGTTGAGGYWVTDVGNNTFQNGTQTILLVRDSTAAEDDDIDDDDDGAIDGDAPWAELIDAVALFDDVPTTGNQDVTYAGDSVLTRTETAFRGASRIPDGVDTDSASDWVSNTARFDNAGITSGEAYNTPGAENAVAE